MKICTNTPIALPKLRMFVKHGFILFFELHTICSFANHIVYKILPNASKSQNDQHSESLYHNNMFLNLQNTNAHACVLHNTFLKSADVRFTGNIIYISTNFVTQLYKQNPLFKLLLNCKSYGYKNSSYTALIKIHGHLHYDPVLSLLMKPSQQSHLTGSFPNPHSLSPLVLSDPFPLKWLICLFRFLNLNLVERVVAH